MAGPDSRAVVWITLNLWVAPSVEWGSRGGEIVG